MGRSFTFCLLHRFRRRRVKTERQVLSACVTKRRNYLRLRAHYSRLRVQIPIGCSRICQLAWRRGLLFYGYPNCSLARATIQDLFTNNAFYQADLGPEPDAGAVVGGRTGLSESAEYDAQCPEPCQFESAVHRCPTGKFRIRSKAVCDRAPAWA